MQLHQARARYLEHKLRALNATNMTFKSVLSVGFRVGTWTTRAQQCIRDQWGGHRHPDVAWDWDAILHRHRDPDAFAFAGWVNEHRLGFVGLAVTTSISVELKFVEGDPREDCPIGGSRALIALDLSANYAESCGKQEVWVRPVNPTLERLYISLGFEVGAPTGQPRYFRRRV